ncbi:DUF2059 domain-containing protein [Sulfitobacter mediterraneus]|uniref:DUF2059 domain-containing protein n=1 Tax=Sulfitobacter mediterraneus TaxID=83219 RepID=UPI001EEF3621|nr:DUF2059 domain-containing protein [Sulfitobacter mediterraneus]
MIRGFAIAPLLLMLAFAPAWADARLTVLVDVLKLREAALILREEGITYAEDLNTDMLAGDGGAGWQQQVEAIYDPARMVEMVRRDLKIGVFGEDRGDVIAFFSSDLGVQIVDLENSARAAIQDPDIEAAARERYAALAGGDDPRLAMIHEMVEGGDMINRNVTSAMNANYQFMRGLVTGGALEMSDDDILRDVASEIDEITEDTTAWLYGYMLLAYSPLSDDELATYVAFAQTQAGQSLNAALFDGFGKAYEDISYALGRAVALNMTAQEL